MRQVEDFDNMTPYEALSHRIGFHSDTPVRIPPVEVAKNLLKLVKMANSIEATEAVMRVVRFSPAAKNDEEREAKQICCEASRLARQAFGGDF